MNNEWAKCSVTVSWIDNTGVCESRTSSAFEYAEDAGFSNDVQSEAIALVTQGQELGGDILVSALKKYLDYDEKNSLRPQSVKALAEMVAKRRGPQ